MPIPENASIEAEFGAETPAEKLAAKSHAFAGITTQYIRDNPRQTALIALALGVILGRWAAH